MIWNKLKQEIDSLAPSPEAVRTLAEKMERMQRRPQRNYAPLWKTAAALTLVLAIFAAGTFGFGFWEKPVPSAPGSSESVAPSAKKPSPFVLVAYAAADAPQEDSAAPPKSSVTLQPNLQVSLPSSRLFVTPDGSIFFADSNATIQENGDGGYFLVETGGEPPRPVNWPPFGKGGFLRTFQSGIAIDCTGENLKAVSYESADCRVHVFDGERFDALIVSGFVGISVFLDPSQEELPWFSREKKVTFYDEKVTFYDENDQPYDDEIVRQVYRSGEKVSGNPANCDFFWTWNFSQEYLDRILAGGSLAHDPVTILVTAETHDGQIAKQQVQFSIDKDGYVHALATEAE